MMNSEALHNSPFLRACRREKTAYTPIWLMRQAGRYLPDYRKIREKHAFLEMCKRPELVTEVTVMPIEQIGFDAAIIFADILLIAEPMGLELTFQEGSGPSLSPAIRTPGDVDKLRSVHASESLGFVFDAIRMVRRALPPRTPLIGFCGAPFTVASYMIEGGASRRFQHTKALMYSDPDTWNMLLGKIACASAGYLNGQIDAGVQAVQIFDSWVGCLSEEDYRRYVLPHTQHLISALKPGIPIIHFAADGGILLPAVRDLGADVLSLDWRVNLADAWATIGYDTAVQGNLDPVVLCCDRPTIINAAETILERAGERPGHIFNLGHGILPDTPVDNVRILVDVVHEHNGA